MVHQNIRLSRLKICVQALYLAAVVRPVDPEVEERLAQETEVRRTEDDLGDKVHPPCGYGLLQAKEEARKLRKLRALMRVSTHRDFVNKNEKKMKKFPGCLQTMGAVKGIRLDSIFL